jgi:hypothetical protein
MHREQKREIGVLNDWNQYAIDGKEDTHKQKGVLI